MLRATRNDLDAAILASWQAHKMAETDISTERLTAKVRGDTSESGRQVEALHEAGVFCDHIFRRLPDHALRAG
jgi:hypothetical protein